MQCPVDRHPLAGTAAPSRGFHRCGACAGLWVEAAELRRLAGRGEAQLHAAVRGAGTLTLAQASRGCPACGAALHCYVVEGVEVDLCPGCHGLWLDAGELEAVRAWYLRRGAAGHGRRERPEDAGDAVDLVDLALDAPDLVRAGGGALRAGASGAEWAGEAVTEFVVYVARDVVFEGIVGLIDGL